MQDTYVGRLIRQRRILQIGYAGVILAYTACVLVLFFDIQASIIMINATTIFYFFVMRSMDKNYNRSFVKANLKLSGEQQLDCVSVYCKGTITSSHLHQHALLPVRAHGGCLCGIGFHGQNGKYQAEVCELTVCFDRIEPGIKQKIGILNGVWLELDFKKCNERDFVLVDRSIFDSGIRPEYYVQIGYHEVLIRSHELSKRFCLFGKLNSSGQDSERFIGACGQLIRKTLENGSSLMIGNSDMGICVFLVGRKLSFDTPIRGEITEDIIAWNRLPEFAMLLDIAKHQ